MTRPFTGGGRGRAVLGVVALVALAGCGITVDTEWDRSASFAQLRTYAWEEAEPPPGSRPVIESVRDDTVIRTTVERELAARGYEKTFTGTPDFVVDYRVVIANPNYPYGTLVLTIRDPSTLQQLWSGSAKNVIDPGDRKATDANTREGIRKMLSRFPPD